eukprot:IDg21741t1
METLGVAAADHQPLQLIEFMMSVLHETLSVKTIKRLVPLMMSVTGHLSYSSSFLKTELGYFLSYAASPPHAPQNALNDSIKL